MKKSLAVALIFLAGSMLGQTKKKLQAFTISTPSGGPPNVTLNWGASATSGVTYNVYASATQGGEKKPVLANVNSLTYTDTSLTFNSQRFYEVTACLGCKADGTGGAESTPTNEVSVLIPMQPSPPGTLQTPIIVYP